MNLKKWSWFDDGLIPLLVTLLRALWLWPWLGLIQRGVSPSFQGIILSVGTITLLPFLSLNLARLLTIQDGDDERVDANNKPAISVASRAVVAVVGLLAMLLVTWWHHFQLDYGLQNLAWLGALGESLIRFDINDLPGTALTLLVAAFLWLSGLLDSTKSFSHDDIWRSFVVGFIALVVYLLILTVDGGENTFLISDASTPILLYFAVGMAALAFSSLKTSVSLDRALGFGQRTNNKRPQMSRYWLFSVTAVILILLGVGLLIGFLIAPENIARLLAWIGVGLQLILQAIGFVAIMVGYVLVLIAYYVMQLIRPLLGDLDREPQKQQFGPADEPPPTPAPIGSELTTVPDSYRWLGLAALTIVLLIAFAIVLRRLQAASHDDEDEIRESILTSDLLQDQMANLWNRWMQRFRSAADWNPFLSLENEPDTRRTIREAYQGLLSRAIDVGKPRQPEQTPTEYKGRLQETVTTSEQALNTLTEGYLQARYGSTSPSVEEAEEVGKAWDEIEAEMKAKVEDGGDADERG